MFQPRSFRRYQTLGCIDVPERVGKRAMYGYRHFVQALLVRKLLWEHLPADRIAALMAGRRTEETKRMLFEGVEMAARQGGGAVVEESGEVVETRKRVRVTPGVEIHLRDDLPKLKPAAVAGATGGCAAEEYLNLDLQEFAFGGRPLRQPWGRIGGRDKGG